MDFFKKTEELARVIKLLANSKRVIISGSFALVLQGIIKESESNDIDIVLEGPDEATIAILEKLAFYKNPSKKLYKLEFGGVRFDVFPVEIDNEPVIRLIESVQGFRLDMINQVALHTFPKVLKAKRGYNRPKDIVQMAQWSVQLFLNDRAIDDMKSNCIISGSKSEY